ncbi:MAG: thioredoxin family protein [Candidatus Chromulinivorax sp.]
MKKIIKTILLHTFLVIPFTVQNCPNTMHNESIIQITSSENLQNLLKNNQGPTVIAFYMDNCPYCKEIMPFFEKAAEKSEFCHITFYSANGPIVNAEKYILNFLKKQLPGYPTLYFLNQGKIQDQIIGAASQDTIIQKLNNLSNQPGLKKQK